MDKIRQNSAFKRLTSCMLFALLLLLHFSLASTSPVKAVAGVFGSDYGSYFTMVDASTDYALTINSQHRNRNKPINQVSDLPIQKEEACTLLFAIACFVLLLSEASLISKDILSSYICKTVVARK